MSEQRPDKSARESMSRPVLDFADTLYPGLRNKRVSECSPEESIVAGIAWMADNSEYGVDDAARKLIDEFRAFLATRSHGAASTAGETRRTDAFVAGAYMKPYYADERFVKFARQLERELAGVAATPSASVTRNTQSNKIAKTTAEEAWRRFEAVRKGNMYAPEVGYFIGIVEHVTQMASDETLKWGATWIENSAALNPDPAVKEFAANMVMTIRSQVGKSIAATDGGHGNG